MIFGEVAEWFRRKPAKLDTMVRFHPSSPLISEVEGAQMSSYFFTGKFTIQSDDRRTG